MRILLFLLAVLAALGGLVTHAMAQTISQQILGGVLFVIAAVLLSGAAIVDAIVNLSGRIEAARPDQEGPLTRTGEATISTAALDTMVKSGALRPRS